MSSNELQDNNIKTLQKNVDKLIEVVIVGNGEPSLIRKIDATNTKIDRVDTKMVVLQVSTQKSFNSIFKLGWLIAGLILSQIVLIQTEKESTMRVMLGIDVDVTPLHRTVELSDKPVIK